MISVEEMVELTEGKEAEETFRLGIVEALFVHGTAQVKFDGEEEASEKEYSYLKTYRPEVGDRIALARVGGSYIILGALNYAVAPEENGPSQSYLFDEQEVVMTQGLDVSGALKAKSGVAVTGAMAASGKVSGSSLETSGAATIEGVLNASGGGDLSGEFTHSGLVTFNGGIGASTANWNHLPYLRADVFQHRGNSLGFFNKSPVTRPSGTAYDTLYSSATLDQVIAKVNLYINLLKNYGLAP